jgi:hypothetical protein
MANQAHVKILRQGFEVWNQWRKDNPNVLPSLSRAVLSYADLSNTHLSLADLREADLSNVDLRRADLHSADLSRADLSEADLRSAHLSDAHLSDVYLIGADLSRANLIGADLSRADLSRADLSRADLSRADLSDAAFTEVILENTMCSGTIFADLDLSTAKRLDTVHHNSPSSIGIDTLFQSKGMIPEIFLRGCGVPQTLIKALPSMLEDASKFYSCFISYSHDDKEFAERLYDRLWNVGVVCWKDDHQLNPGDEFHTDIHKAIHTYDKMILCCSKTALTSWWVEEEFKIVISKEKDYAEKLLIPLTLDNYVFEQSEAELMIANIKRRIIGRFDNRKDHDTYETEFEKVVKALRTDGGKPPPPSSKLTRRT